MTTPSAPPSGPPRALLLALVAVAAVSAAAVAVLLATGAFGDDEPERAPGLRGDALPDAVTSTKAPDIALTDALTGRPFDTSSLKGEPYVLTFLYTGCVDVCPLIGADIRDAIADLGEDGKEVTPVIVTVDPRGDTPLAVRAWVGRLSLPSNTRYLIGGREDLVPIWRDWYLIAQGATNLEARSHNASVWLIDDTQRPRARYSGGGPIPVGDLSSDLDTLVSEASTRSG